MHYSKKQNRRPEFQQLLRLFVLCICARSLWAQSTGPAGGGVILVPGNKTLDKRQAESLRTTLASIHASHEPEVDRAFSAIRINVHQLLNEKASSKIWSTLAIQTTVQRVILDSIPPQPIQDGKLFPAIAKGVIPIIPPLSPSEEAMVIKLAASVGRLEVSLPDGSRQNRGTVFVVGQNTVATNCHVVE
jgi:hypothetical protein